MEDTEPTQLVLPLLSVFRPEGFYFETILGIVIILVLLVILAIIAGSETAFFSLLPADIDKIKNLKTRNGRIAGKLLNHPEKLLSTILLSINLVTVSIVVLFSFIASSFFDFGNYPAGIILVIIVITSFLILFNTMLPKGIASKHALSFALFTATGLNILQFLFKPFNKLLINSTDIVNKILIKKNVGVSIEQLSHALELTEVSTSDEKNILKGIVKFGNIFVSEIMRSRVNVIAVDINLPYNELIKIINDSGYSRIPVYSGVFDEIKGILYIKDLLLHIDRPADFKWQALIRPSYFIPESKKINDLLKEFQSKHIHMAVVVDEYGGTSGIVTLEDILEEIVGEIADESDIEEKWYKKLDTNSYLIDGKAQLNDLYKVLQVPDATFDEVKGDADTLAGLILEIGGELPEKNSILTFKDFVFEIKEVDDRRIILIQVTLKSNTIA